MDRETRHELGRLRDGLLRALDEVGSAADDETAVRAWRQVQTLAWELNEVLPVRT